MEDQSARLQALFSRYEQDLKRELTYEERRLLALADLLFPEQEPGDAMVRGWNESA